MFDFLKKKSYKIEEDNSMKKIVVAKKYSKETFNEYITKLTEKKDMLDKIIAGLNNIKDLYTIVDKIPESMKDKIKITVDYNFKSEDNLIKAFNDFDIKALGDAIKEAKDAKDTAKEASDQEENGSEKEEKSEETSEKQESEKENNVDVNSLFTEKTDLNKEIEQSINNTNKLQRTADKAPGSSKYRAEGIKERLLEINKEVVNVKTPGVTYVGGVDKSVITPGPKSTSVKVKEEVVRPDIVVQNVKIRIMRDEGEKGKLLPEKNIKMPKGDVVVKKAATDNQKVKQLSEDKRAEYYAKKEKAKLENKSAEEFDRIDKEFGVSASLYDEAMNKIFAEASDVEQEEDNIQTIMDRIDLIQKDLSSL